MGGLNVLADFGVGTMVGLTGVGGGALHHRKGSVDWQVVRRLCLGSLPASIAIVLALVGLRLVLVLG